MESQTMEPIQGYGSGQVPIIAQPVGTSIVVPPGMLPRVTEFPAQLYVFHPMPVTNLTDLPSESMNHPCCITHCHPGPFPLSTVITCFSFQHYCVSSRIVVVSRCRTIIHLHIRIRERHGCE